MVVEVNTGGLKKFVYDSKRGDSEEYIRESLKEEMRDNYFNNLWDGSIKKKLKRQMKLCEFSLVLRSKKGKQNKKFNVSIDWEWGHMPQDVKKLLDCHSFVDKFEIELPAGEEYKIEVTEKYWLIFTKILFSEKIKLIKNIKEVISF